MIVKQFWAFCWYDPNAMIKLIKSLKSLCMMNTTSQKDMLMQDLPQIVWPLRVTGPGREGGRKDEFEEARQDFKDVEMLLHQKILFKIRALPVAPYYSTHFWSRANFQNRWIGWWDRMVDRYWGRGWLWMNGWMDLWYWCMNDLL